MDQHRPRPPGYEETPQDRTGTYYGYFVTQYVCIIFISLFGLTGAMHLGQAIWYRRWWLIPTMVACALAETIGWAGRLWSSVNPRPLDAFLMQICCTILAPSFMTAGLFIMLGLIVTQLGEQYSRLRPKVYSVVFITADLVALVVQAVGGARASLALTNGGDPEQGAKVMVGGIIWQMAAITMYVLTAAEFLFRYHSNKPIRAVSPPMDEKGGSGPHRGVLDKNVKMVLAGMVISTVFLYIRSIYRTIELLDGWTGKIITNETLFNALDGMPIVVAMFVLNIFHPGMFLGRPAVSDAESIKDRTAVPSPTRSTVLKGDE